MNDEEYQKLREKIKIEEHSIDDFNFENGFLRNIKDKNNKESFIEFLNILSKQEYNEIFDQFVKVIENKYCKVENIPSAKEIFKAINSRIKDKESSIEYNKTETVELMKKRDEEKDYDKLKKIESDLFWSEHRIDESKKEVYFLEEMKRLIIFDIQRARKRLNKV